MKHISNILKNFTNLSEYTEFLNQLVEADGSEISRGKDPNDKSKVEKEEEVPEEGGEEEAPLEGEEGEEAVVVDPVAAPGSQVAIGNKDLDDVDDPKAVPVKISGNKDKIDTKPKQVVNPNYT